MLPDWTRMPRPPVPYNRLERFSDRWHGWLDGRKGLPVVSELPDDPDAGVDTPTLTLMRHRIGEWVSSERRACILDCDPVHEDLEQARLAWARWNEALEAAGAELARLAEPDSARLTARRLSETDHPEALVRKRRVKEHAKELARAQAHYEEVQRQRQAAAAEITRCEVIIESRWKAAAEQALGWSEHYQQRIAVYWQRLVRTHRQGPRLNGLLPHAVTELPRWVTHPAAAVAEEYRLRPGLEGSPS
jgi:hypothetical protein